jgi:hypothetical protein
MQVDYAQEKCGRQSEKHGWAQVMKVEYPLRNNDPLAMQVEYPCRKANPQSYRLHTGPVQGYLVTKVNIQPCNPPSPKLTSKIEYYALV